MFFVLNGERELASEGVRFRRRYMAGKRCYAGSWALRQSTDRKALREHCEGITKPRNPRHFDTLVEAGETWFGTVLKTLPVA